MQSQHYKERMHQALCRRDVPKTQLIQLNVLLSPQGKMFSLVQHLKVLSFPPYRRKMLIEMLIRTTSKLIRGGEKVIQPRDCLWELPRYPMGVCFC